jgi:HEAT repeat protein
LVVGQRRNGIDHNDKIVFVAGCFQANDELRTFVRRVVAMESLEARIAWYLDRHRSGNRSDAFFDLIELGSSALPILIDAFHKETDISVKVCLLNAIWEYRSPVSIPVLAESLNDPEPEVWKQALDGLVAMKSREALNILNAAKLCRIERDTEAVEFRSWLDEAIEQLTEQIRNG